jgi:hypothetical protein
VSAIAEFYVVPRSQVAALENAASAGYESYIPTLLEANVARIQYQYSGWVLATLLQVLPNDFQINLMNSEKQLALALTELTEATHIVMTVAEKDAYAEKLDPALFSPEKLEKAYEDFNETKAPGIGEIMQNGIRFLRAGLMQLTPETVAILVIG